MLHELLARLHTIVPGLAYNLALHSAPFRGAAKDSLESYVNETLYHWHWELVPRLSSLAGLELGAGVYINPLSPEHAAERLRGM